MKRGMPYDCEGQDGIDNSNEWRKLPVALQLSIRQVQSTIQKAVETFNPDAEPTSGWRCAQVGLRWKSKINSLHPYGWARDFKKGTVNKLPDFLEVIHEETHDHVQYKRGC